MQSSKWLSYAEATGKEPEDVFPYEFKVGRRKFVVAHFLHPLHGEYLALLFDPPKSYQLDISQDYCWYSSSIADVVQSLGIGALIPNIFMDKIIEQTKLDCEHHRAWMIDQKKLCKQQEVICRQYESKRTSENVQIIT